MIRIAKYTSTRIRLYEIAKLKASHAKHHIGLRRSHIQVVSCVVATSLIQNPIYSNKLNLMLFVFSFMLS